MNVNRDLIDRIVSNVMEQLQSRPAAVRSQGVDVHAEQPTEQAQTGNNGVLFSENVVTADTLEHQLGGSRQITIGPKSVLTPSARDLLRSRSITWTRQSEQQMQAATCRWKAIVLQSTPGVVSAVDDVAGSGGVCWECELAGCPSEAVSAAVSAVCRADAAGVAVFADDVHSLICRANRNRHVRAAVVTDVPTVEAVGSGMGANVLGINPDGKSYFELRNMLRAFTAGGPPEVPAEWDE